MAKPLCSIRGCGRPVKARGWCPKHYLQWWATGDPLTVKRGLVTPIERFWRRIERQPDGCWLWTGQLSQAGYAVFSVKSKGGYGHRFAYETLVEPIPDGLELDHLCRNRACVNPAHLEPVTHQENILRSPISPLALNAKKTHCTHGHPLDGVRKNGGRYCKTCSREAYYRRPFQTQTRVEADFARTGPELGQGFGQRGAA